MEMMMISVREEYSNLCINQNKEKVNIIEEDVHHVEEVDEFDDNVPFVSFSDEDNKVFDGTFFKIFFFYRFVHNSSGDEQLK